MTSVKNDIRIPTGIHIRAGEEAYTGPFVFSPLKQTLIAQSRSNQISTYSMSLLPDASLADIASSRSTKRCA